MILEQVAQQVHITASITLRPMRMSALRTPLHRPRLLGALAIPEMDVTLHATLSGYQWLLYHVNATVYPVMWVTID